MRDPIDFESCENQRKTERIKNKNYFFDLIKWKSQAYQMKDMWDVDLVSTPSSKNVSLRESKSKCICFSSYALPIIVLATCQIYFGTWKAPSSNCSLVPCQHHYCSCGFSLDTYNIYEYVRYSFTLFLHRFSFLACYICVCVWVFVRMRVVRYECNVCNVLYFVY